MRGFFAMLGLLVLVVGETNAQSYCAPHESMVAQLERNYGEHLVAIGFAESGALFEVFASEEGIFTIVFTSPGRLSCVRMTGYSWEIVVQPVQEEPA